MPGKRSNDGQDVAVSKKKMRQCVLNEKTSAVDKEYWTLNDSLAIYTPPNVRHKSKVLAMDVDGTVITTSSGRVFPIDTNDWKIISPNVYEVLKLYHDKEFKLVFMSNQRGLEKDASKIPSFQLKIQNIITKLGLPIQAFISLKSDVNRKPRTGMWKSLEMENGSLPVSIADSIYCGDAAGRDAIGKIKKDHSASDRLFALNVGVTFKTPEELWHNANCDRPFYSLSFDPKCLQNAIEQAVYSPTLNKETKPELVLMIGFPASGKSTYCKDHFSKLGYCIVSQDLMRSPEKCVKEVDRALSVNESVVVDNTNLDVTSRQRYLKIASKFNVKTRAFVMTTTFVHAQHNEIFRQLTDSSHKPINTMVFNMMRSKYQEPTADEGFTQIIKIPFIPNPHSRFQHLYFQYLLEK